MVTTLEAPPALPQLPTLSKPNQDFLVYFLKCAEDVAVVAERCNTTEVEILAWTSRPEIAAYLAQSHRLNLQRKRNRALEILDGLLTRTRDPVESRRLATTMLRATDPRPFRPVRIMRNDPQPPAARPSSILQSASVQPSRAATSQEPAAHDQTVASEATSQPTAQASPPGASQSSPTDASPESAHDPSDHPGRDPSPLASDDSLDPMPSEQEPETAQSSSPASDAETASAQPCSRDTSALQPDQTIESDQDELDPESTSPATSSPVPSTLNPLKSPAKTPQKPLSAQLRSRDAP